MHTNWLYIFNTLRRENAYTLFFFLHTSGKIWKQKYTFFIHAISYLLPICHSEHCVGWSPALIERFSWGSWKLCWSYRPHYAYTEHTTLYLCVYNCRWRGVIQKRNQICKWSFTWGKFKPSALSHNDIPAVSHNDIQHRKTGEP